MMNDSEISDKENNKDNAEEESYKSNFFFVGPSNGKDRDPLLNNCHDLAQLYITHGMSYERCQTVEEAYGHQ